MLCFSRLQRGRNIHTRKIRWYQDLVTYCNIHNFVKMALDVFMGTCTSFRLLFKVRCLTLTLILFTWLTGFATL